MGVFLAIAVLGGGNFRTETFAQTPPDSEPGYWLPERNCRLVRLGETTRVEAVGGEPRLYRKFQLTCEDFHCTLRIRTKTESSIVFQWITRRSPRRGDDKMLTVPLIADGNWHDYDIVIPVDGTLLGMSVRLSARTGSWEFGSLRTRRKAPPAFRLLETRLHAFSPDNPNDQGVAFTIQNAAPESIGFTISGNPKQTLGSGKTMTLLVRLKQIGALGEAILRLQPDEGPPVVFPAFYHFPEAEVAWSALPVGSFVLDVSPDARMAQLRDGESVVAIIAPLVHREGRIPAFQVVDANSSVDAGVSTENGATNVLAFESPEVVLRIETAGNEVRFHIRDRSQREPQGARLMDYPAEYDTPQNVPQETSTDVATPNSDVNTDMNTGSGGADDVAEKKPDVPTRSAASSASTGTSEKTVASTAPLEGPCVRVLGEFRGGLLAGVEFLGPGDKSSSPIDILEPDNYRYEPDPRWLTSPLAILATDRARAVLSWKDPSTVPVFSVPNIFDASPDQRMALKGNAVDAVIRFEAASDDPLPELILDAVKRRGLPEPGSAPRDPEAQRRLCLDALTGPLQGPDRTSWAYAAEEAWPRKPFADTASILWRLTGKLPRFPVPVVGGSDIADEASFFLTGRATDWKNAGTTQARQIVSQMQPDGTFLSRSVFPEIEQPAAVPGYCAIKTLQLLEWVRYSGDVQLFAAAERSLEAMGRFDVPRGGFYREAPLHTPDLLTAAYMTWTYVWAYELSGKQEYLDRACRWAACGLPFVYQWGDRPVMTYATVAKLGGTSRKEPLDFGNAQPWVGLVYAYSLLLLAPHDTNFDWRRLAEGIVTTAERMQETNGPNAGCLPERFQLDTQLRSGWNISPCSLITLRLALDGAPHALFITADAKDRVVSPFPIELDNSGAVVLGVPAGMHFQVMQNGNAVHSGVGSGNGRDQINLE